MSFQHYNSKCHSNWPFGAFLKPLQHPKEAWYEMIPVDQNQLGEIIACKIPNAVNPDHFNNLSIWSMDTNEQVTSSWLRLQMFLAKTSQKCCKVITKCYSKLAVDFTVSDTNNSMSLHFVFNISLTKSLSIYNGPNHICHLINQL